VLRHCGAQQPHPRCELDAPHLTIFPGLAIALLVLGFNFLGDGLRDATDPKRVGR